MEPRILLVSTYSELTKNANDIASKLGIPIAVHNGGILKDGVSYAKSMESNYDVIISVASTAASISKVVSIPVVSIEISAIDVLEALIKAKEYGDSIALVSHRTEELYGIQRLKSILNVDFSLFPYSDKAELEKQIEDSTTKEKLTIVGIGGCFMELAEKRNLKGVLIKNSISAITKALVSAKNICDLRKREKEKAERFKAIVDYSRDGILTIDTNKKITSLNPAAEKILNMKSDDAIDRSIMDFKWYGSLGDTLDDGKQELGKIVNVNNTQAVLNTVPIYVDSERMGTVFTIEEVASIQKLERKVRAELYSKGLVAKYSFNDIIGHGSGIKKAIERAVRFAKTNGTILIYGETGCGKELFAQSIHNVSDRKNGPFVAINCAALPDNLLESELFGYEDGAFTGARKGGKIGLLELAHGGTVFLDEIGEIPLSLQTKLLRVLQERSVMKIGSDHIINIDIRVIAATNKNLYKLIKEGNFREDLFFRLNVLNLKIPPLRERKEDINILVMYFIKVMNRKYGTDIQDISDKAIELLKSYNWPGNVRELESFVEKTIILSKGPEIDEQDIRQLLAEHNSYKSMELGDKYEEDTDGMIKIAEGQLKDMELQIIETISKKVKGDKIQLAEKLGISRSTLWKRLNELEKNNES